MSLSEKIRSARKNAGLTQQALADLIGVAKSTFSGYEKGDREPDALKLKLIAKYTGVTGDYLLETEHSTVPTPAFSPEALALAAIFDRLDPHSKRVVESVARIESERTPINLPKGIIPMGAMPMHMIPHFGDAVCDGSVEAKHAAKGELAEMQSSEPLPVE